MRYSIFDNYPTKIAKVQKELDMLKEKQKLFLEELKKLKTGDIVHISDSGDFFPQRIIEVDLNNMQLNVIEESIDRESTITGFYILENNNFRYVG